MDELSVLIGGRAGDGINQAGLLIARLLNHLGFRVYMYFSYPSLIRGGHNFSIIRAAKNRVATHRDKIDFLLALNQDTVDFHQQRLKDTSHIIYDSDTTEAEGLGLNLANIIKQENASSLMRNTCLIGAFAKSVGIKWEYLEDVFRKSISKEADLNLQVAQRGYNESREFFKIDALRQKKMSILSGNEAIGLGLVKAGLTSYIAYPMTPSSSLLHYLAQIAKEFNIKVIHPENEIAVMLMGLGFSYAGQKCAVGTSGGGFCLMAEGISLAGMAELAIVIVVAQRPGPSTGVPTYTAQTDLNFVLNAGQGEFVRFVVAPGDAEEAFYFSHLAMNISVKFQIPSIILSDKALSEGYYNFDLDSIETLPEENYLFWDNRAPYKRYLDTDTGVSPLTFVSNQKAIIKVNSYEHDEDGLTTEDVQKITKMYAKRLRKEKYLLQELENYEVVKTYGKIDSSDALLCWGSNKGVCVEVAEMLGLRVIQPLVLSPFPVNQFKKALQGINKIIAVENNATGQLVRLINGYGFNVEAKILKYDGRPFAVEQLQERLKELLKDGR
jgi:2-oxoglutarate ferredoxin oxidoreductase subunit alpha